MQTFAGLMTAFCFALAGVSLVWGAYHAVLHTYGVFKGSDDYYDGIMCTRWSCAAALCFIAGLFLGGWI